MAGTTRPPEAMMWESIGVKVDVYMRIRPPLAHELSSEIENTEILRAETSESAVYFTNTVGTRKFKEKYTFEGVFGPESTQQEVYDAAVRPLITDVSNGLNCAVFAYGQTGAGKTHTMEGAVGHSEERGMIPRAMEDLWSTMGSKGIDRFNVTVSMVEIYNENLEDLFVPTTPEDRLKLMEDPKRGGTYCRNLYEVAVKSPSQIADLLTFAGDRVKRAETVSSKSSSRAHHIFILTNTFIDVDGMKKVGRLTMVDLAGSETSSGKDDVRSRETKAINTSLLTFGRVIQSLAQHHPRVPYRDSKLTRLVSEALGGYCNTTIIACGSPMATSEEETQCTIRYSQLARRILNKPQVNIALLLQREIEVMKAEHSAELARERANSTVLAEKLETVRIMRDMLLDQHQTTEVKLTSDARKLEATVAVAASDVEELQAHVQTQEKTNTINVKAVQSFSSEVARQVGDIQTKMNEHAQMSSSRSHELVSSIDGFAESRASEMRALTTELEELADVYTLAQDADLERARTLGQEVQEVVETAEEEALTGHKRVAAAASASKHEVKAKIDGLAAKLRALEDKLFDWRMETRTLVEQQEKASETFADGIAEDISSLSGYVAQESNAAQSNLETLDVALQSHLASEQAAQRSANAALVASVTEMLREHSEASISRQATSVTDFRDRVAKAQSNIRALEDGVTSRVVAFGEKATGLVEETRTAASNAKTTTDAQHQVLTDASASVQRAATAVEQCAGTGLDELSEVLNTESSAASKALTHSVNLVSKYLTTAHTDAEQSAQTIAEAAGKVVRAAGERSAQFTESCRSIKHRITDASSSESSFQSRISENLDYLAKSSDQFATRDFISTRIEVPVQHREYPVPPHLSATPPYLDILKDFSEDWRAEIHHQKNALRNGLGVGSVCSTGSGRRGSSALVPHRRDSVATSPSNSVATHNTTGTASGEVKLLADDNKHHRSMSRKSMSSRHSVASSVGSSGSRRRSSVGPSSRRKRSSSAKPPPPPPLAPNRHTNGIAAPTHPYQQAHQQPREGYIEETKGEVNPGERVDETLDTSGALDDSIDQGTSTHYAAFESEEEDDELDHQRRERPVVAKEYQVEEEESKSTSLKDMTLNLDGAWGEEDMDEYL